MSIKILLFDLGGVLIDVQSTERLYELAGHRMAPEEIAARWLVSPSLRRLEHGRCDAGSFAADAVHEFGLSVTPQAFLDEFALFTKGFYPGAAELLRALRPRYGLACLSDTNAVQWQSMCERLSIDAYLDHRFLSFEIGMMKPQPEIFAHVLRALPCDPEEIAYFDDRQINVAAGAVAGMNAYAVNGIDELREKLAVLGLI